ncbi:hypothetical protein MRB53_002068 [Persea americana]|uniref:Uncharacterized protein n=1 Tax=Persea americana TaxID=3435 RepID=A0ACC2MTI4_PERAE|nr:hypothetical protein MRB53_002068 [Persea americana]
MMVDDGLQGAGRGQSGDDGDAWGVRRMEMRDLECVQRGEMEERGDGCTGSLGSASDGDEGSGMRAEGRDGGEGADREPEEERWREMEMGAEEERRQGGDGSRLRWEVDGGVGEMEMGSLGSASREPEEQRWREMETGAEEERKMMDSDGGERDLGEVRDVQDDERRWREDGDGGQDGGGWKKGGGDMDGGAAKWVGDGETGLMRAEMEEAA